MSRSVLVLVTTQWALVSAGVLCPRAGGQHPRLDAATAAYETAEACIARGCTAHPETGECHYAVPRALSNITTVHLIQSNHFDAGFTDQLDTVINSYFTVFFPGAVRLAAELRSQGGEERLRGG